MMRDQAASLREMMRSRSGRVRLPARTVAVVSGKGGVGKTTIAVNLALAIASQANDGDVLLWDADVSLANANVLLNMEARATIADVLNGDAAIEDALIKFHEHAYLLSGSSGIHWLASLTEGEVEVLLSRVMSIMHMFKFAIIDAPAGIGALVLALASCADLTLLVTTPEPAALMDAYALLKAVKARMLGCRPYILVNMSDADGISAGERLARACRDFLGMDVQVLAVIPRDRWVCEASMQRLPLLKLAPMSEAASTINRIGAKLTELLEQCSACS